MPPPTATGRMEGQEFLIQSLATVGASSRGECRFTFSIGSVQSSLQVCPAALPQRAMERAEKAVKAQGEGCVSARRSGFQCSM